MLLQRNRSSLHLQLGQEVIYLLLAAFGTLSFVLAVTLVTKVSAFNETLHRQEDKFNAENKGLNLKLSALELENKKLKSIVVALDDQTAQASTLLERLQQLARMNEVLRTEVEALRTENGRMKQDLKIARAQQSSKPPIINLKETEGFSFPVGEATLTQDFQEKLKNEVLRAILAAAAQDNAKVIEVIGHTDEQPVVGRTSNLDQQLIPFFRATRSPATSAGGVPLVAGDNAGLGMARAAAVAKFLMMLPPLVDFKILPMSGAQLINTDDAITTGTDTKDAGARRRIELRARRANN